MLSLFTKPPRTPQWSVKMLPVGPGGVGKTVMLNGLLKALGMYAPMSGIQVGPRSPEDGIGFLKTVREKEHQFAQDGSARTVELVDLTLLARQGSRTWARAELSDIIGQSMVDIGKDARPEQLKRYEELRGHMDRADVLLLVVPCPSGSGPGSAADQFPYLVQIVNTHLVDWLARRAPGKTAAAAIVLSQTDAGFGSREEARAALTDDVLHRSLGPLVSTLLHDRNVTEAAIFPVSGFGYGASKRLPIAAHVDGPTRPLGGLFETRSGSLLDGPMDPDNLVELFLWAMLSVLMYAPIGNGTAAATTDLLEFLRPLADDFLALSPWFVPVKGRLRQAS